jgi:hypothetical protein
MNEVCQINRKQKFEKRGLAHAELVTKIDESGSLGNYRLGENSYYHQGELA